VVRNPHRAKAKPDRVSLLVVAVLINRALPFRFREPRWAASGALQVLESFTAKKIFNGLERQRQKNGRLGQGGLFLLEITMY